MPKGERIYLVDPQEDDATAVYKGKTCYALYGSSLYFQVGDPDDDEDGSWRDTTVNHPIQLSIEYFDRGTEDIVVGYTTNGTSETTQVLVTKTNTLKWKTKHFKISSSAMIGSSFYSANGLADIRLYSDGDIYVSTVDAAETDMGTDATNQASGNQSIFKKDIASDNYDTGVSGWMISRDGDAEFSDVIVRGTIYATAGEIGQFVIESTYIRDAADSFGLASTVTGGDDVRFWAGDTYLNRATAPFRVYESGAIHARSGTVGGWTLGTSAFTGGNATLHSSGYLLLGTSNDIVRMDATDGTYRLWTGNATAASAPFRVTKTGVLTATNAFITGTIHAQLGDIADFEIGTGYIRDAADSFGLASTVTGGDDVRFWAGGTFASRATAPFRVYESGTVYAGAGIIIDAPNQKIYVGSGAPRIAIEGINKRVVTTTYVSGIQGFALNGSDGSAEFGNIVARGEIRAFVFKINEIAATAGTLGVFYSASTAYADITTPASLSSSYSFDAKNSDASAMLFGVGDIVRIKGWDGTGLSDAWSTITARTNHTSYTTYTATLNSGSTSATFPAGAAIVDYGPSGTGYITLSADGTVGSTPNLTMATHAGSPWSAQTPLLRIGNVNGTLDYSSDAYGFAFGEITSSPSASSRFISYDPTNGLRIQGRVTIGGGGNAGYGVNIGDALTVLRFDGPQLYNLDYTGNSNGHKGQVGTFSNTGFYFHYGRFGKALVPGESMTNKVLNPSAEAGSNYAAHGGATISRPVTTAAFGSTVYQVVINSANDGLDLTLSTLANAVHYVTFFAGAANQSTWEVSLNNTNWVSTSFRETIVVNGRTYGRYGAQISAAQSNGSTTLHLRNTASSGTCYIDGVQVEQDVVPTPYWDGSINGGAGWDGTANASTSTRPTTTLTYPLSGNLVTNGGTIMGWMHINSTNEGVYHHLFYAAGTSAGVIALRVNSSGAPQAAWGTTVINGTAVGSGWHHYAMVYDGTTVYLYVDGQFHNSGAGTGFSGVPSVFYIGSGGTSNYCNGKITDVVVKYEQLTADEIAAIYASNMRVEVQTNTSELRLTDQGQGQVIGNANGLFGMDSSGVAAFGLLAGDVNSLVWGGANEALTSGDVMFGSNASGGSNMLWDNSAGSIFLRTGTTKKISLAASTGNVFIGSNLASVDTTSISIFSSSTSYNGDSLAVGDILIGSSSTGQPNALWDDSAGTMIFRYGKTVQVTIGNGITLNGTLTGGTIQTSSGNPKTIMTSNSLRSLDGSGNVVFGVATANSQSWNSNPYGTHDTGDVTIGSDDQIFYDSSNGLLTLNAFAIRKVDNSGTGAIHLDPLGSSHVRFSTGPQTIHSIKPLPGAIGQLLVIKNDSTTTLTLKNTTSTTPPSGYKKINCMKGGADITIQNYGHALMIYDPTAVSGAGGWTVIAYRSVNTVQGLASAMDAFESGIADVTFDWVPPGVVANVAGTMQYNKSSGTIAIDFTVPTSGTWTIYVMNQSGNNWLFADGDVIYAKNSSGSTWFTVTQDTKVNFDPDDVAPDAHMSMQSYTCTYASGTKDITYYGGHGLIDYGASGQGYMSLTANDTNSPFLSIRTHAGSPWTTTTEVMRVGNMKNSYGVGASDYYGFGVGDYSAGNYLSYNTNDGLVFKGTTSAASIALGSNPPTSPTSGSGIFIDYTGVYGINADVQQAYIQSVDGAFLGGNGVVRIDDTAIFVGGGSTGWKSGGTFDNDTSSGSNNWSNPSNAASSDDSYATAVPLAGDTARLKITNFGFSVPSGTTIKGITVSIERKRSGISGPEWYIKLYKAGTLAGTEVSDYDATSSDAYFVYGAPDDLWGTTWTYTDINNSGFGVGIYLKDMTATAGTVSIDHVRIKVYYRVNGLGIGYPTVGNSLIYMNEYSISDLNDITMSGDILSSGDIDTNYITAVRVGIGGTPADLLHIQGSGGGFTFDTINASGGTAPGILGRKARGTPGSESQVQSGDRLFGLYGRGYTNSGAYSGSAVSVIMYADEAFTSSANGTYLAFSTTPKTTTSSAERVRIPSDGGIAIQDGITAPATLSGWAKIYVDSADGDLKVKFGDGTVKTIVVDT